jgi:quinol monooxygenase YgiN
MLKPKIFNQFSTWIIASLLAIAVGLLFAVPAFAISVSGSTTPAFLAQTQGSQEPVVTLANQFIVSKDQLPEFLDRWSEIGEYMKQQPGFVSAELQKDILNPQEWIMSEQWKSLTAYRRAISTEAFQALVKEFPAKATWFAQDLFPAH